MSPSPKKIGCGHADLVAPYALATLNRDETEAMRAHLPSCLECRRELETLEPVTGVLSAWRTQTLPTPMPLWERLLKRIGSHDRNSVEPKAAAVSTSTPGWPEPEWRNVAPGISCKLLSTDTERDRVTMLVRLAPDTSYPPHRHSGVEELYLLEGELWIEDRRLLPGDYNHATPGTADQRVWSQTGCMCLLITSPSDQLG
jgi:anti-sigma factor ChrR (cupin superfamily)